MLSHTFTLSEHLGQMFLFSLKSMLKLHPSAKVLGGGA
jgi:hypothetical protein